MHAKKLMIICMVSLVITSISKVYAVTARIPNKTNDTAEYHQTQVNGSRSVLDIISLVNDYLWFAVWFFCFVFMIWNGYKLITANWDEKAMEAAKNGLVWSGIWLAICLLAYIIVNIAVKLFA